MAFLTGIAYKRGAYIASMNERNKQKQFKIISIYILLIYLNYLLYNSSNTSDEKEKNQSHGDFLIYYVFNCEFLFLFIKIVLELLFDLSSIILFAWVKVFSLSICFILILFYNSA